MTHFLFVDTVPSKPRGEWTNIEGRGKIVEDEGMQSECCPNQSWIANDLYPDCLDFNF